MNVCGNVKQMFNRKRGYEGETGVFTRENEVDDFLLDEETVFLIMKRRQIFVCVKVESVLLLSTFCFGLRMSGPL